MAINYTLLFSQLGKLASHMKVWDTLQTTLATTNPQDIAQLFIGYRYDLVANVQTQFDSRVSTVQGWTTAHKTLADSILSALQSELVVPNGNMETILPALAAQMKKDEETVLLNTVTVSAVASATTNIGNGTLVVSKANIAGDDDQRIIAESVSVLCVGDRISGGAAGYETFTIAGLPANAAASYKTRGNGSLTAFGVHYSNRLTNGSFDSFSSNTPASWTISAGAAGTNVLENTTLVHPASGGSALRLVAGAATRVTLSQTPTSLNPDNVYCLGAWLRKAGTVAAGGTLNVYIGGTGMTPVPIFNADPATLTTSYALVNAFVRFPNGVPFDVKVYIDWTVGTGGAAAEILIDDLAMPTCVSFGHVYYAMFRGSTDFIKGDKFTLTTTNDYVGAFQTFFGRFYNTMLPSAAAESNTIDDALATP